MEPRQFTENLGQTFVRNFIEHILEKLCRIASTVRIFFLGILSFVENRFVEMMELGLKHSELALPHRPLHFYQQYAEYKGPDYVSQIQFLTLLSDAHKKLQLTKQRYAGPTLGVTMHAILFNYRRYLHNHNEGISSQLQISQLNHILVAFKISGIVLNAAYFLRMQNRRYQKT